MKITVLYIASVLYFGTVLPPSTSGSLQKNGDTPTVLLETTSEEELKFSNTNSYQNRIQQIWIRDTFIGGFILMLIVSALIYYNYMRKARANSRLQGLNNEIKNQQIKLANQALKVQELNESLNAINETLEIKIKARTKELHDKNNELELKNRKLEEYAFINAHLLRAPIAKLLGLIQVIDAKSLDEYGHSSMLESLRSCTTELDTVVRQIAIAIRNEEYH